MTPDPIKALVDLGPELQKRYDSRSVMNPTGSILLTYEEAPTILAAIEALKPLADGTHVVVGSVFLNDLRAIADTGGRRIETAMDACDKIIELIDMERRLGPVSTAPVDEGRVERIVKAFEGVLLDINFAIEQGILPNIMNDMIYVEARAALAAIKGVE